MGTMAEYRRRAALAALGSIAIGAWRGIHVGRSAVASHRRSVRVGVRLGRWQTVLVAVMVVALIGGAR
jgi:hypothetical protein